MRTERLHLKLHDQGILPPFMKHHYLYVLKMPLPELPSYPDEVTLEFVEKGLDKLLAKLNEALARRRWEEFESSPEEVKKKQPGDNHGGLAGYFAGKSNEVAAGKAMISSSFASLNTLRDSAAKLVLTAVICPGRAR